MNQTTDNSSNNIPRSQIITARVFLIITLLFFGFMVKIAFFETTTIVENSEKLLVYLALLVSLGVSTFELFTVKKESNSYFKELKTFLIIFIAISIFYGLFFIVNKLSGNSRLMGLSIVFGLLIITIISLSVCIYKKLDELQRILIIKSLALSALSTIAFKLTLELYILFINPALTVDFTAIWMTVYLCFSSVIFAVILFYKDDNSDFSYEE